MLKGTLSQKVFILLGIVATLVGIYQSIVWLLLIIAGNIIIFLAFKDYESMTKVSEE